ncbi:MAG: alpha/beta hydrolase [Clostridia bacterium]|nr:alpha/beta hydrolase [Clostridia bacterium]
MKHIKNVPFADDAFRMLDLYLPEQESFPVFVYFHGGGLVAGDRTGSAASMIFLAEHGVAVASVEYRMYPEAKYPEFIEDCALAIAWVKKNFSKYGNVEGIYAGGSSAGGYLSMMLCFDPKYLRAVGIDPLEIAGWFHDAGQPTKHFNVLKYSGEDERRVIVDESAPLYHIGTQKEHSPMRFIVSDNDMENRYEQTMLVLSTMKHFGYSRYDHKVMHGKHCHYCNTVDGKEGGLGALVLDFIQDLPI